MSHLRWSLGTELRSSARLVRALSPALYVDFCCLFCKQLTWLDTYYKHVSWAEAQISAHLLYLSGICPMCSLNSLVLAFSFRDFFPHSVEVLVATDDILWFKRPSCTILVPLLKVDFTLDTGNSPYAFLSPLP